MTMVGGPHADARVATAGSPLSEARAAVVALHGRGATARSVLALATELDVGDVAWLGPQAAGNTWYPYSFMADTADNEPHLSSALELVEETVERAVDAGIPRERVVLLGFSQGACLASEYVARNATRFGGLVAFSGGLIGPLGMEFDHEGDAEGTPVFFGCSDSDPHIPEERVTESADVFERLDANVEVRIYPNMAHTIIDDEVEYVADLLENLASDV